MSLGFSGPARTGVGCGYWHGKNKNSCRMNLDGQHGDGGSSTSKVKAGFCMHSLRLGALFKTKPTHRFFVN